ncbi:MAG: MmcB family DNA repair protein [Rhodospirillaceae bacterium]|nr:MmcB family DNA repair protein [Rhodospirillaceae bacterium]
MTDPDPEFPATAARILRGATRLLEGLGYAAIAEYTLGNGRRATSSRSTAPGR